MMKRNAECSHAGGVVYRFMNGAPEFFIITGKHNRSDWILPKGHIEDGETPEETALRELAEETGLEGEIRAELGTGGYRYKGEIVRIKFFLIEKTGGDETHAPEGRRWRWMTYRNALALVSFRIYRTQLKRARRILEQWRGNAPYTIPG